MKIILLFLLFCLICQPAIPQTSKPMYLGIRCGLNLSNNIYSTALKTGTSKNSGSALTMGIYADYSLNENFFLMPEIFYVKSEVTVSDAIIRLEYLAIPVSLKYKFNLTESNFIPFIFGGGYLGIIGPTESEYKGVIDKGIRNLVENYDLGLQFGGGSELKVSPKINILLEGRYSLGIKNLDIRTEYPVGTSNKPKILNRNFGIMTGISCLIN